MFLAPKQAFKSDFWLSISELFPHRTLSYCRRLEMCKSSHLDQWFPTTFLEAPNTACFPYHLNQTHLIQIISSLVETPWPELGLGLLYCVYLKLIRCSRYRCCCYVVKTYVKILQKFPFVYHEKKKSKCVGLDWHEGE